MTETRTRKAQIDLDAYVERVTLPQFIRVATEAEVCASVLDEGAKRILEPGNEQPVSALERGVAAILTNAAQETRDFVNQKRLASPASSANGYGGA